MTSTVSSFSHAAIYLKSSQSGIRTKLKLEWFKAYAIISMVETSYFYVQEHKSCAGVVS